MKTTLSRIRSHRPCEDGWRKLLKHLSKTQADDEELSLLTILESNGLYDTLWCFRAVKDFDREKRLYAVWCASQVKDLLSLEGQQGLEMAVELAEGKASYADVDDFYTRSGCWVPESRSGRAKIYACSSARLAARSAILAFNPGYAAVPTSLAACDAAGYLAARTFENLNREASKAEQDRQQQELKRVLECTEAGKDPYSRSST